MGLVFVLPNQLVTTKLIEVLIVFPKLEVLALTLVAGYFVKDTQISCVIVRAKLLYDLGQESHLFLGQELCTLSGVEVEDKAILLDLGLK